MEKLLICFCFLAMFSCKKTSAPLVKEYSKSNTDSKKVEITESKEKTTIYKRLTKIIKKISVGDTMSIALTTEYVIPESGELKYDSTYYKKGVFINVFDSFILNIKSDSLENLIDHQKIDYRIEMTGDGNPEFAKINSWEFGIPTRYDWFLTTEMPASSDYIETTLIGFKNNESKIIAQEYSMDLNQAILKDSVLIFNQQFIDTLENGFKTYIDSVRINIYSSEKETFKINQ